jgi:hypothetical protein
MKTKPNTQLKASQGLTLSVAAFLAATSIAFAQDATPAAPAEPLAPPPAVIVETPAPPAAPVVAPAPAIAVPAPSAAVVAEAPAPKKASNDVPVVNAGGTKISLYGFVQFNGVYEDGRQDAVFASPNWTEIAPPKAEKGEGRFLLNVNQTRIGFNFSGPNAEGSGTEVSGKFETDFANDQDRRGNGLGGFRIRHAYGQVKFTDLGLTLLVGQAADLIGPLSAPTLNQGALRRQGSIGTRRPMIRLSQAVSLLEISAAVTDDRADKPVIPAFQGSIKAKVPAAWAGEKQNVELTLSGHYAAEESAADDSAGVKAKDADGYIDPPSSWSGNVALSLPIIDIIGLTGEVFYGQNLNRYSNGSIGRSGTATGHPRDEGIQSLGGWGALAVKLPAGFSLTGGLGLESIDKDRELKSGSSTDADGKVTITPNPNKNIAIFGNLKYNIAQTAFVGFEYTNITTEYASTASGTKVDDGKLNRFELAFNYAFK